MTHPLKNFRCLALALLAAHCVAASPALAVAVSADTNGGYGAQVMDIILSNWKQPAGATGSTSVIVRITTDGRPFSCELRKSSGNPSVDDSVCLAVAKAGMFPPAPYAAPAEVALTFRYDSANALVGASPAAVGTPAAPPPPVKTFADIIMDNARPHLVLPEGLKGEHSATVRLLVLPDGSLGEYKMEKSTGQANLDAALLRALLQPGVIPAPPDAKEQNVYLTFTYGAK